MYYFKQETDTEKFDKFVEENKGSYLQCSSWPKVKTAWNSYLYSGYDEDEALVLTALVLERKIPGAGKIWYISCGPVVSIEDEKLIDSFWTYMSAQMKSYKAFCIITDPLAPLRIDGVSNERGLKMHESLTRNGFVLNPDIDTYTYKHPVQTMIDLKDEEGNEISADKILKGCEKGVRYSVRVGASRGLEFKRYKYDDVLQNPQIMDEFMSVMEDTSDRNSFAARNDEYILNLMKNLDKYTDIMIVYYDKKLDRELEEERQKRKEEVIAALSTAPQKKIRGLQDELEVIEKNSHSYNQRLSETSDYLPDEKIAVAGGLTIRFGGVASCVFGGTRNIVRNNTRSSHYLNYWRMCESIEEGMDYHDLGYVLVKNPSILEDGTLGPMEPVDNFVGICDFKKSFGAKYYEFVGEYVLVGNKKRYWLYKELMPKAKHTLVKIKLKLKK